MRRFLVRRLATLPIVLVGVSLILFGISQIIPSDPVRLIVGDAATPDVREAIRKSLGLDQPVLVQYGRYVERLLQGNFGTSIRYGLPVSEMIQTAFPATLALVAGGALVAIVVAFPLGLVAATWRNTWVDVLARGIAIFGMSTPAFFLGIVLILVFGFYLGIFPIAGRGDPPDVAHLILPATVLGLRYAGSTARLLRASMLDAFHEDFIRAARARGIAERVIVLKYAFRNALIPSVTDLGVSLADMLGSVILVETIFAWPGMGSLVNIGILWNDFPLVAGCTFVLVLYAVAVNLIVDVLYGIIDPRIRFA